MRRYSVLFFLIIVLIYFLSGCVSHEKEMDLITIEQRLFEDIDRVIIFQTPRNRYLDKQQVEKLRKTIRNGEDLSELPQSQLSNLMRNPNNIVFGLSNIANFVYETNTGYIYVHKSDVNRELLQKYERSQIYDLKTIEKYLIGDYKFRPSPEFKSIIEP